MSQNLLSRPELCLENEANCVPCQTKDLTKKNKNTKGNYHHIY
jgi:hypothetical protein